MEKKEFNRYFNFHVKTLFERFNSDHIIIEYSKNMAKLKFRNENVGNIEFKFLTGKQLSVGAIASVFMTAKVFGGDVWREIVECDKFRKKETNVYNNYLYSFYSSSSNSPFFKNSKTDFFPSDDIKEKLCGFLDFVSKEILNKIFNVLMKKSMAIDDILDTPHYYGQPELSMLMLCRDSPNKQSFSMIEEDKRFISSKVINKKIWNANKAIILDKDSE